jgi:type II secretory pathway pseudopilin PulG
MAVLLIGMAITAVWMSALLPAWRQQVTRQREQDLIFRGEQYARAVALYVMRNQCALPTNVDDLVARKYLRKKWKDPITNDDFILVPGPQPGQSGQPGGGGPVRGGGPGGAAPVGGGGRTGATPVGGGGATPVGIGGGQTGSPSGSQSGRGRAGQPTTGQPSGGFPGQSSQSNQSLGVGSGIAGVVSKSTGTSIMIYNGQQTYSGWQFMYQNELRKMGQTPQCGQGQPGARPGQPGQPGGRGDGRGGPGGPGGVRGGPPPPGGRGDGRGVGRGEVPPPTVVGRGRGGGQ